MARRHGGKPAAGRLQLDGADAAVVVGAGEGAHALPPAGVERLYHADRSEIWSEPQIAAFMGVASEPLQRALVLALETGQRQGDLLTLPWSAYDGAWIKLKQGKTGRRVSIPVTRRLRAVLENTPKTATVILTNKRGIAWQGNRFRKAWGDATRKAKIEDRTFHDLRGTSVTRLAEAECSAAGIAAINGHSMRDVGAILDKYLARTGIAKCGGSLPLSIGGHARN
jgi:integrase